MGVGRLLSYWEGNFSGATLNFGRVSGQTTTTTIRPKPELFGQFGGGGDFLTITSIWRNSQPAVKGREEICQEICYELHLCIATFFVLYSLTKI